MRNSLRLLGATPALAFALFASGQCGPISIGPDVTICQGQNASFSLPPGYPSYLWSTGATTPNLVTGTAGTYWGQVSYPSGNIVGNGNFNGGNSGFWSEFTYDPNLQVDGNYYIGTNANTYHPLWMCTGSGNFLMVNAGWTNVWWSFWCQGMPVCPGQTYTLSFRMASLADTGPPTVGWIVDWSYSLGSFTASSVQGQWNTYTTTLTTGPSQTWLDLCLRVTSGWGVGNDIGIDDISVSSTIVLRDTAVVNVTPLPVVNLGPDQTLCDGQSTLLNAAVPGGSYLWQDGSTSNFYNVTGPGSYNVTVTANGCSNSDAINVAYNPLPVVDLGNDTTVCPGEPVPLNAALPGGSYVWQDGSTAPTFTATAPGVYDVDVTVNGCTSSDAITVSNFIPPVVALGPDITACAGDIVPLSISIPGASYLWSTGATSNGINVSTTATYWVEASVNGCPVRDSIDVFFNALPVFDLGNDTIVCPGEPVLLDATLPGATYLWQDGSTSSTYASTSPGAYSVDVTVGGCTSSDAITITNYVPPVVALGPDITACVGDAVPLSMTIPGASYLWSTGSTATGISVTVDGTYWGEATVNGCPARDSVLVSFTPLPVVTLGNDTSVCPGDLVVLDATLPGASYVWSTGGITPTLSAGPGSYSVDVTVGGCTGSDAINIGAFAPPVVSLGSDTSLCPGATLLLNATGPGLGYLWQDGSTAATLLVSVAGPYSVTITDGNGCTASDAINVGYVSPSAIDLGPDTTICAGTPFTLDATQPGASYLWSTGATTPTITVNSAGVFSVTVDQGACSATDTITVGLATPPTVDLGNDTTICSGSMLTLTMNIPGTTNLWIGGSTGPDLFVVGGGAWYVTVTDSLGCSATDTVMVYDQTPVPISIGPDQTICDGLSITLDATYPGGSYVWSTGATSPTISATASGTYWVEVVQGNCVVTDTMSLTVVPLPVFDLGNDTTLCSGASLLIDATTPSATYLWSTGDTSPSITVSTAATYMVDVTVSGCTSSDAIDVAVLAPGSINLGPDTSFCAGGVLVLDATLPGATYSWSTGASSSTISVNSTGLYSVIADVGGCSTSDAIDVTVLPLPVFDLGNDTTLCAGSSLLIDATTPAATYLWSTGDISPSITVSTAATYTVDVAAAGCTASDAIVVAVLAPGAIDLGPDTSFCAGGVLLLDATLPGATYSWSTGASSSTISVNSTGLYSVIADVGGCTATDAIDVTVLPLPVFDLGNDTTLCSGTSLLIDATTPGATYLWSTGATSASITVGTAATYTVDVTAAGCTASDAIDVAVLVPGSIDLGPDTSFCAGGVLVLDATLSGATYSWSTGASSSTISVTSTGLYSVTADVSGCSTTDAIDVTVLPLPIVDLGSDTVLCDGSTLVLTAAQPGASYLWQDGSTLPNYTVTGPGGYGVTVDVGGCTATDAIGVGYFSAGVVDLGPDQEICPGSTLLLDATAPGATYLWQDGSSASTYTADASGTYWVLINVSGCTDQDSIDVNVTAIPQPDLGPDGTFCEGDTAQLSVVPGAASVLWSDGSTGSAINATTSGTYTVQLTLNGCVETDAVQLTFMPFIDQIDLGEGLTVCEDAPTTLDAFVPGASYLWSTGSHASSIQVTEAGLYSVILTGECISASDTVMVTPGDCAPLVHVPNSFTPEGDGHNEVFAPVIVGEVSDYELLIFDRWGEAIFTSTAPAIGWDGRVNGTEAPIGVYVWAMRYKALTDDGLVQQRLSGHVNLLR